MKTSNHYKLTIFDDQYSLVSDESQEHMTEAARIVDSLMKEIAIKATNAESKKIAVLVALQIASKLLKLESLHQHDEEKQKQLIEFINRECREFVNR